MSASTERIAILTAQIAEKQKRVPVLQNAIASWKGVAAGLNCSKGTPKKKKECQDKLNEANTKISQYQGELDGLTGPLGTITAMNKEIASLQQMVESEGKSQLILANQGKSLESVALEAKGQADAIKTAETIKAQAVADATTKQANSSQTVTYVIIAVVFVVVVVGGIMVIKKLKKKK